MMRRLRLASLVLATAMAVPAIVSAQDPGSAAQESKAKDVRRLLELTGAAQMGQQMIDQMIDLQRRALPEVPEEFWSEMRSVFDVSELTEITAAIWDRHFTHEDVLGLIGFFESPLGTRFLEAQPQILGEAMAAGEAWGIRAFEKLMDGLRQKGYSKTASGTGASSRRTMG